MDEEDLKEEFTLKGTLDNLMQILYSSDKGVQLAALAEIRKQYKIAKGKQSSAAHLLKYDVPTKLMEISADFSSFLSQRQAIRLLSTLVIDEPKIGKAVQQRVISISSEIVSKHPDFQIRNDTWWLLASVISTASGGERIFLPDQIINAAAEWLRILLLHFFPNAPSLKISSSSFNDQQLVDVFSKGITTSFPQTSSTFSFAVHTEYDSQEKTATHTLSTEEGFLATIMFFFNESRWCKPLIKKISDYGFSICDAALSNTFHFMCRCDAIRVLSEIFEDDSKCAEKFSMNGGVNVMFQLSADHQNVLEEETLMIIIRQISTLDSELLTAPIYSEPSLKLIRYSLISGGPQLQNYATLALSNMATESEQRTELLCRLGFLRHLVSTLSSSTASFEVQENVLFAFKHLTLTSSLVKRMMIEECSHLAVGMALGRFLTKFKEATSACHFTHSNDAVDKWAQLINKSLFVLKHLLDEGQELVKLQIARKRKELKKRNRKLTKKTSASNKISSQVDHLNEDSLKTCEEDKDNDIGMAYDEDTSNLTAQPSYPSSINSDNSLLQPSPFPATSLNYTSPSPFTSFAPPLPLAPVPTNVLPSLSSSTPAFSSFSSSSSSSSFSPSPSSMITSHKIEAVSSSGSTASTHSQAPLYNQSKNILIKDLVENIVLRELVISHYSEYITECIQVCSGKEQLMAKFIYSKYVCAFPWIEMDQEEEEDEEEEGDGSSAMNESENTRDLTGMETQTATTSAQSKQDATFNSKPKQMKGNGSSVKPPSSGDRVAEFIDTINLLDILDTIQEESMEDKAYKKKLKMQFSMTQRRMTKKRRQEMSYFQVQTLSGGDAGEQSLMGLSEEELAMADDESGEEDEEEELEEGSAVDGEGESADEGDSEEGSSDRDWATNEELIESDAENAYKDLSSIPTLDETPSLQPPLHDLWPTFNPSTTES